MESQIAADRYELSRRIGSGGMAHVYLGHDRVLKRAVAVKVLHSDTASDPLFVERFKREAQAAASLNHPNIVGVYDWGTVDNTYYMVMEFVPGADLKVHLQTGGVTEIEALLIGEQIARALDAAHRQGIIHRDVKPHNVLIAPDGQVKVADFGIARAAGLSQLTRTNMVAGTAHYLSPEQLQRQPVDGRSDVYSLGVVLYEMLTGREPFTGESLVEVALQHVHDAPVAPRRIRPQLSRASEAIALKALQKDPRKRYQNATEMADAMRRARLQVEEEQPKGKRLDPAIPISGDPQPTEALPPAGQPSRREAAHSTAVAQPLVPPAPVLATRGAYTERDAGEHRGWMAWMMAIPVLLGALVLGAFLLFRSMGPSHTASNRVATPPPRPQVVAGHKPTATVRPKATSTPARAVSAGTPRSTPASPSATSLPTPAATATSNTALSASALPGGASEAVSSLYQYIGNGDFRNAAALYDANMKVVCDPVLCISQRFANAQSVTASVQSVKPQSADTALVSVSVVDQEKAGSPRKSGTYLVTYTVKRVGSAWLIDNYSA